MEGGPVTINKPEGSAEVQRDRDREQLGIVTSRFRLVLGTVLALTVMLLLVDMILVLTLSNPSTQAQNLMDLCSRLVTIGFGAIIGLLGGKAT
jgi:hypothetical protein